MEIIDQASNFFEYTVTQSNGEYRILGMYDGDFVVRAVKNRFVTEYTDPFSISASTNATITKDLVMYTADPPTNNLQGSAFSNRSLLTEDRVHRLTWSATTSPEVTGYRVFNNGTLVASVGLTDPLVYESHNNPVDDVSVYTVVSVNSDGTQSTGSMIQLQ